MKRALLVVTALLVCVTTASAQVELGWGDSPTAGAPTDLFPNCTSNSGAHEIVVSFVPMSDLLAVRELDIDLVVSNGHITTCICTPERPPLPPYWDFSPGACRAGSISLLTDFSVAPFAGSALVHDPWESPPVAWSGPFYVQMHAPASEGIYEEGHYPIGFWIPQGIELNLYAGQEYYLARIPVSNAHSTDPAGCLGCCEPALFDAKVYVNLGNISGLVGFSQTWLTWQFPYSTACAPVPTRTNTWGALKSAYR